MITRPRVLLFHEKATRLMKENMLKWEIDKFWFETFEIVFELNQISQSEFIWQKQKQSYGSLYSKEFGSP